MNRRRFIEYGILVGCSPCLIDAKTNMPNKEVLQAPFLVIEEVLEHIFPDGTQIPSAKEVGLVQFVHDTIMHISYDKDIRSFVIDGAKELDKRTQSKFRDMKKTQKEMALRSYEMTEYGQRWLGRILTLGMEGLFSDPIYGANPKESCWKALGTYGGQPRPKVRYLGVV